MEYLDLLNRLARMLAEATGEVRKGLLFAFAPLLERPVQAQLAVELDRLLPAEPDRHATLSAVLQALRAKSDELDAGGTWLFGCGILEQFCRACENGEHTWRSAAERLDAPVFQELLTAPYARRYGQLLFHGATDKDWRLLLPKMRLLRHATQTWAARGEPWLDAVLEVGESWLKCVTVALIKSWDGRLQREALADVEHLLTVAKGASPAAQVGIYYAAGALCLDPYMADQNAAAARIELQRRRQRFIEEAGMELAILPTEEWEMLKPEEALARAVTLLQHAAAMRNAPMRGSVLKALAQAYEWRELYVGPSVHVNIVPLCEEALQWYNEEDFPHQVASLREMLRRAVGRESTVPPAPFDAPTIRARFLRIVDSHGPTMAFQYLLPQFATSTGDDPSPLWQLVNLVRADVQRLCGESERKRFALAQIDLLEALAKHENLAIEASPSLMDRLRHRPIAFARLRDEFRHRCAAENWLGRQQLLSAVTLFAPAQRLNAEGELHELLGTIHLSRPLLTEYGETLLFVVALAAQGAGVNAWTARDGRDARTAGRWYAEALAHFLDLGLATCALDTLNDLRDVSEAARESVEISFDLAATLAKYSVRLENLGGPVATTTIQQICANLMASIEEDKVDTDVILRLLQVAKGARFSAARAAPLEAKRVLDPEQEAWLARYRELLRGNTVGQAPAPAEIVSDPLSELRLSSYIEPAGELQDESPAARLVYAAKRFDASVYARATGGNFVTADAYLDDPNLRAALDENTVLLNFYTGATSTYRRQFVVLGFTRDGQFAITRRREKTPDAFDATVVVDSVSVTGFGGLVSGVREKLVREPLLRAADPEALEALADATRELLGTLQQTLEDLHRGGKRYLCVVPHGPLHYFPFHLLGLPGRLLADDWTVTYLPALQLLAPRAPTGPAKPRAGVQTFGMSNQAYNPHGLTSVPETRSGAAKIGEMFGTPAHLDEEATEARFATALESCRRVHLATHGKLDVLAPAFQTVYLAPDAGNDGRVEAHEILRLDLEGLDLLTLSACETGLGRFDLADNLRGIPASFFMAGARTLVGTLWPVESETARFFFQELYCTLKDGKGKREAFRQAQVKTRRDFPAYRDWGAFCYYGEWGSNLSSATV